MAIEDAAVLGLLAATEPLDDLAERLAAERHARVARVHADSWQIGQMAHWHGTTKRWLHDTLFRATPTWLVRRSMRTLYDPGIELAGRLSG